MMCSAAPLRDDDILFILLYYNNMSVAKSRSRLHQQQSPRDAFLLCTDDVRRRPRSGVQVPTIPKTCDSIREGLAREFLNNDLQESWTITASAINGVKKNKLARLLQLKAQRIILCCTS